MKKRSFISKTSLLFSLALALASCAAPVAPEHEHVWDQGEVTTAPTCHSEGTKTFHCTVPNCPQTKLENLAMTPHNWDHGQITKEPTCTEKGIRTYRCLNEGCEEEKLVYLEKEEHQFEEGGLFRIPDLLQEGSREFVCAVCGEKEYKAVPAHADFEEQFANPAYSWGVGHLSSFDPSALTIQPEQIPFDSKTDSYKSEAVEVHADSLSLSSGSLALAYPIVSNDTICLNLAASFKGQTSTDALSAHFLVVDEEGNVAFVKEIHGLASSWDVDGSDLYDVKGGDTVLLVLSGEGKGSFALTFSASCVHIWDEGKVKRASTCAEEGIYEYTCIVCGATKDKPIERADHTWNEGEIVRQATEEEEGIYRYTCEVCGLTRDEKIPVKAHLLTSFEDDFSTQGDNHWVYGYATDYDFGANTFSFHALEPGEGEWGGVEGLTIKSDWVCNEADGKNLAVGYEIPTGQSEITVDLSFAAVAESAGATRMSARLLLIGQDGSTKHFEFFGEGIEKASWERKHTLAAEAGDTLFVLLFNEASDWRQGRLGIEIFGQKSGEASTHVKLVMNENVFGEPDKGSTPLESNVWVDERGAHSEVTVACDDVWRARMFINTGVDTVVGGKYKVEFDLSKLNDTAFELILQSAEWDGARYYFADSGEAGHLSLEFEVEEGNSGTLWIAIQMGNVVNEVTINNIVVTSLVEPLDPSEPIRVKLAMNENVYAEPDKGSTPLESNVWVDDNGAHSEVTVASDDVWRARMFIDTGVATASGEKYTVEFDLTKLYDTAFELILQNKEWDGDRYYFSDTGDTGHMKLDLEIPEGKGGTLWIAIQMGNVVNEVTINNIVITPRDAPVVPEKGGYVDFVAGENVFGEPDKGSTPLESNVWVDDNGAHSEVTVASDDVWRARMFIDTGVSAEEGKKYLVSFDLAVKEDTAFEFILQNKQWDADRLYFDDSGLDSGHFDLEVEVPSGKGGTLWVAIQMGNVVNEVTISNLFVKEMGSPIAFAMNENVYAEPDKGSTPLESNVWVDDNGAHSEVTVASDDVWRARMFINAGVSLEEGKSYYVSFDVALKSETAYELILSNAEWDGHRFYFNDAGLSGHVSTTIEIPAGKGGTLWLAVQMGNVINEITISNLTVVAK